MGFLHPALLWLGVAGSIPIIIHLFNRQRYKRIRWAAMEWLLAAMKKTRRRMQIENLILLAIRVLVLVVLASALARPFMQSALAAPFAESNTHVVIVLDVSYSMDYRGPDRSTPLEKARQVAQRLLNDLKTTEADRFSLILLTDSPQAAIGEPSSRVDMGRELVGTAQATDMGTSIPETMGLVRDALKKSDNFVKKVFLITDNQRHAWRVEEKDRPRVAELFKEIGDLCAPNGGGIVIHDVGGNVVDNLAIVGLDTGPGTRVLSTDKPQEFVATLRNYGPLQVSGTTLSILVDGSKQGSFEVTVPPHDTVSQTFYHTFREPGPHAVTVEVEADSLLHDNRRSLALDVRDALRVLVVNGEKDSSFQRDETAAFKAALNPSMDQRERVDMYAITEVLENGFAREDPRRYELVVLANVETVSQEEVAALEEYVRAGGGLLVFLGDKVEPHTWNELLWKAGAGLLPCELDKPAGYQDNRDIFRVTGVDFTHPALAFFTGPNLRIALSKLYISQYFAVKPLEPRPDVRVLMSLGIPGQENAPLLLERRLGRGRVVLCTTAADFEWSLMPKVPGYVMLFDQISQYLASPPQRFRNITVGDPIEYTLKVHEFSRKFTVITPALTRTDVYPVRSGEQAFHVAYQATEKAGLYGLERDPQEGETQAVLLTWYAVNVDPDEGYVEKMTEPELRTMYPQFKFTYVEHGTTATIADVSVKPPASNIWKYLVGLVLGLLVIETVLAQLFGSKR